MAGIKLPLLAYIFNRYNNATSSRPGTLEMRAAFGGKQKYMSTGIRLLPKEWQHGRVVNREDAVILNKTLDKLMNDVRQVIYEMAEEGNIDIFAIPARLDAKKRKSMTFSEFFKEKAEIRKHGICKGSQERYDLVPRVLEEFGRIKFFTDLTPNNIVAFERFLIKKGMKPTSRWANYHSILQRFIKEAIREGFLERDPYESVRIDHGDFDDSIEKFLTVEELKKLREAKMPDERLARVRDLFIFQSYTCLAYADLAHFEKSRVVEEDGKKVYLGHRKKSGVRFTVPLLAPAVEILERYNGLPASLTKTKETFGEILDRTNYNRFLKEISEPAGLSQRLTTHWARHTGATMLLNAGVAPEVIAVIGGWKTTKILMKIYAKMQEKTVIKVVNNIEEKIV